MYDYWNRTRLDKELRLVCYCVVSLNMLFICILEHKVYHAKMSGIKKWSEVLEKEICAQKAEVSVQSR